MFHTYVVTRSGNSVDIDRASFRMDKQMFLQVLKDLKNGDTAPSSREPSSVPQDVWDTYCAMHRAKYGTDFEPDVDPDWDHSHRISRGLFAAIVLLPLRKSSKVAWRNG